MNKCVVIVPSMSPMGPIKGAVALANGLSDLGVDVTFISLKIGLGVNSKISSKVKVVNLDYPSNLSLLAMLKKINKIIDDSSQGHQEKLPVLSFCFSADLVNFLCRGNIARISSIRADNAVNYSLDYKFFGGLLSRIHYFFLKFFDLTFAMNQAMKEILVKNGCKEVHLVPNFLNERDHQGVTRIKSTKKDSVDLNFVYLGSLTARKKVHLIVEAISLLNKRGHSFGLKILGNGPLLGDLQLQIEETKDDKIELLGFLDFPLPYIAGCDIMVLPSISEGTPRAVMESLYTGLPCVMRNLNTNDGLVIDGLNGVLFDEDHELEGALLRSSEIYKNTSSLRSLLPQEYSQEVCSKKILAVIDSCFFSKTND